MSVPNPKSTANIMGHPIHPMIVPFPIVFFVSAFVVDIMFLRNGQPGWATAAIWLLAAGLVTAAFAAIAGLTDFAGDLLIRGWLKPGCTLLATLLSASGRARCRTMVLQTWKTQERT